MNDARDKAFAEFERTRESYSPEFDPGAAHRAFNAGWAARKQLDYETALGVKHPKYEEQPR